MLGSFGLKHLNKNQCNYISYLDSSGFPPGWLLSHPKTHLEAARSGVVLQRVPAGTVKVLALVAAASRIILAL